MNNTNLPLRLSLPSKGRLSEDSIAFLRNCGLPIYKPNPRQYQATIQGLDELIVLFQRPGDIVASVRDGSVEFGITGLDIVEEKRGTNGDLMVIHDNLGFGHCSLSIAVPEQLSNVKTMEDLSDFSRTLSQPLRVATKFPVLTGRFLDKYAINYKLISAEGTLETAPTIGYADIISDLVSSGQTLRDNRLRPLTDGLILKSQSVLIANIKALKKKENTLNISRVLLEYFDARLRANENLAIFANMRGTSPQEIADKIFGLETIGGLQGPTISPVVVRQPGESWYAVNIIVRKSVLFKAVNELRSIGGSGVVVQPVNYIFEEEPPYYTAMLQKLEKYSFE